MSDTDVVLEVTIRLVQPWLLGSKEDALVYATEVVKEALEDSAGITNGFMSTQVVHARIRTPDGEWLATEYL